MSAIHTATATDATAPARRGRRSVGALALVAAAVLATVSVVAQPHLSSGSDAARLAALDDAGPRAWIWAVAFVVAQLPMAVAVVAVGRLISDRSPRLARSGAAVAVLGAFGETVAGGFVLIWIVMAHDQAHRTAYAQLYGRLQSSPVMVFSLVGLAGSVTGLLLLSIGVFRSRVAPRWVAPALWVFLLLEYVGSAVLPALGYVAVVAVLAAFVTLSRQVAASEDERTDPTASRPSLPRTRT